MNGEDLLDDRFVRVVVSDYLLMVKDVKGCFFDLVVWFYFGNGV